MREDVHRSRSALKYLMVFCVCFKPPPPGRAPPRASPARIHCRSAEGGQGGGGRERGVGQRLEGAAPGRRRGASSQAGGGGLGTERRDEETGRLPGRDERPLGRVTEMARDVQETIVKQNAMIQDIQNESESLREDLHDITQNSKVMRKVKVKMVAEKEKKKKP